MPRRFQDIDPYTFEDFMAYLFRMNGHRVTQTDYSGDFGADLLLEKEGLSTAVQIKRYATTTKVSVSDINQVIGAREYYDTDDALVVTTSDFSQAARELAESAEVFLWDWERLTTLVSDVFMEGEHYYDYFREEFSEPPDSEDLLEFEIVRIDNDGDELVELMITLENLSGRNLTVHLEYPILLTKNRNQFSASAWRESYFHEGLLLNGATATVACLFPKNQVAEIRRGDTIVLRVQVDGFISPLVLEELVTGVGSSSCYIVTHCYGKSSVEYQRCIAYRDSVLLRTKAGASLVRYYYSLSPHLMKVASVHPFVAIATKVLLRSFIQLCLCLFIRKDQQ